MLMVRLLQALAVSAPCLSCLVVWSRFTCVFVIHAQQL